MSSRFAMNLLLLTCLMLAANSVHAGDQPVPGLAQGELAVVDGVRSCRSDTRDDIERFARRGVARWQATHVRGDVPLLLMLSAYDRGTRAWIGAVRQQAQATAALHAGITHLGTTPIAAQGELPIGLLDNRRPVPDAKAAAKQR